MTYRPEHDDTDQVLDTLVEALRQANTSAGPTDWRPLVLCFEALVRQIAISTDAIIAAEEPATPCPTCDGAGGVDLTDSMILYGVPGGQDYASRCPECKGTGIAAEQEPNPPFRIAVLHPDETWSYTDGEPIDIATAEQGDTP